MNAPSGIALSNTVSMIPLSCHAALTEELKRGCRDVYNLNLCNHSRDQRMSLPGTHGMDSELLAMVVGFLTMNTVNFTSLVASHSPVNHGFWSRLMGEQRTQEKTAHAKALMDLRRLLAEQDSLPWREDRVHYWQKLDRLYKGFDHLDQREINHFFELLMGKSYAQLVAYSYVAVDSTINQSSLADPQYVTSPYVSDLIREDCVLSLFSSAVGQQKHQHSTEQESDSSHYDDWKPDWYGDRGLDESEGFDDAIELETPIYPALSAFSVMNQGMRHATLTAALAKAFSYSVSKHPTKRIHIRFMGESLLIGTLSPKCFSIDSLEVPANNGVNLSKTEALETICVAAANAGLSTSLDDLLSTELGL